MKQNPTTTMSTNPTPTPLHPTKPRTTKRKPSTTNNHHDNHHITTISPLIPTINSAISAAHSFLLSHDLYLLPSHTHSLEASLLSASLSLSKLQSLPLNKQPHVPFSLPYHHLSWFERFFSSSNNEYDDHDHDPRWVPLFRMKKSTFFTLNSTLSDSLSLSLPSISSHFALGVTLYRLAHNVSFSFVGKRFGLSPSDACRCFYTVCRLICDHLVGYLGDFGSDMGRILMGFEGILLPNCCGVLGGEKFNVEGDLLGKNGFVFVQALVDSNGSFLDLSAGWPSTFEPRSILSQTRLFSVVEESKELLKGLSFELVDGNLLPQYILGDSCYPLLPWLVTPFARRVEAESLSSRELEFNDVHKRAMGLVRMAFRRVRANWQLLNRKWNEELVEFLPFIITTCCLLNNFLMKHGERLPDVASGFVGEMEFPVFVDEVNESAERTRDLLASYLSRVNQRI